jgi:predicted nuclease of predicted toxin-antitoxin system
MKFLIDAQLPVKLAQLLRQKGYDVIHTKELPQRNQTSDQEINAISIQDQRIVITKDTDFLESFILYKRPYKLLLVTTGNISNKELESLFLKYLDYLSLQFDQHYYLEINRQAIIIHQ